MSNNIPYDEIDELCIPMVKFFNDIGLTTKFCCQGHNCGYSNEFYIMFHESVTDDMMEEFLLKYSNKYDHTPFVGCFSKWARKMSGKIAYNWRYSIGYTDYKFNQLQAKSDFEKMKRISND